MRRCKLYKENGYIFKEYSGNFQELKYDSNKDDYFLTYQKERFYLNDCLRVNYLYTDVEPARDKNLIGTWQEGYYVYKLIAENERYCESSKFKIVYCPPAI